MEVSQNGWPVSSSPEALGLVPLTVGGVSFGMVRGGKVHEVLSYVANEVHKRVQKANQTYGCWGYAYRENVNSPGVWSNHASGTAIDFNATMHPNGSPTAANWTAGQIATIHQILDEAGGIVRWGGDYQGTPDAMHFEINVPPDQLDGAQVPGASSIWPIGAPSREDWRRIPELTTMSVSYPTMARYGFEGRAYWFFRPTQSGRLSFDALLSHYMDSAVEASEASNGGPSVWLQVYEVVYRPEYDDWTEVEYVGSSSSFSGGLGDYPEWRSQGRFVGEVEAGKTYLIYTQASPEYPWVRTVVRIGDYAVEQPWVQPDDQVHVFARTDGNIKPQRPAGKPLDGIADEYYSPLQYGYGALSQGIGFVGQVTYTRSFGGPWPGTDPAAVECAWRWSRRLNMGGGFIWWSINNGGSWNGTDWDPNVPGYGNCYVFGMGEYNCTQHYTDLPVGYQYFSETPSFGYSDMWWRVFGTSTLFNVKTALSWMRRNGVGAESDESSGTSAPQYLPAIGRYDTIEWNKPWDATPELVDIDYAFDEGQGGGVSQAGVVIKWYLGEPETTPVNQWGIRDYNLWLGNPNGPESWVGTQHHLGDFSGGFSGWRDLPEQYLGKEVIRFAALPVAAFSDSPPFMTLGTGINDYRYRAYQYCAVRVTVRPAQFRVIKDPGIPSISWAGEQAISLAFDDGGKVLY